MRGRQTTSRTRKTRPNRGSATRSQRIARSEGNQDDPRLKDPDLYETLKDKGNSQEKAARISNARANEQMRPSKKGGLQPSHEDWSKKELYGRAREIGIGGRSKMTRTELIDALRHH